MKHVKYVLRADQYIKHVPDYSTFGNEIHDLHWQLADTYHTTNIGQSTLHMSTPSVDVHTLHFAGRRKYNNTYEINLHIDTTTIDSSVDTIVCSISDKT